MIDPYYLAPEGRKAIAAKSAEIRACLEANRALRATSQSLDLDLGERRFGPERRAANGERRTVDRRGLLTVTVEGQVVIRPASGVGRFDQVPHDVTAFGIDDAFRAPQ